MQDALTPSTPDIDLTDPEAIVNYGESIVEKIVQLSEENIDEDDISELKKLHAISLVYLAELDNCAEKCVQKFSEIEGNTDTPPDIYFALKTRRDSLQEVRKTFREVTMAIAELLDIDIVLKRTLSIASALKIDINV